MTDACCEGLSPNSRQASSCLFLLEHRHWLLWAPTATRLTLLGNRMCAGMKQDQALQQQSPTEGSIPQLQPGQLTTGQVLHDYALASICTQYVLV